MTLSPNDTQNNVIQYNDTQHCVSTMILSIVSVQQHLTLCYSVQLHSALESFSIMTIQMMSFMLSSIFHYYSKRLGVVILNVVAPIVYYLTQLLFEI